VWYAVARWTLADCLPDPVVEQRPVRQSGQRIVVGEEVDMLLGALAFGDVVEAADVVRDCAVPVPDGGDRQPGRKDLAILAPVPDLAAPDAAALMQFHISR
jgi:hypothetical protein